jgi:hypothetical protein
MDGAIFHGDKESRRSLIALFLGQAMILLLPVLGVSAANFFLLKFESNYLDRCASSAPWDSQFCPSKGVTVTVFIVPGSRQRALTL